MFAAQIVNLVAIGMFRVQQSDNLLFSKINIAIIIASFMAKVNSSSYGYGISIE